MWLHTAKYNEAEAIINFLQHVTRTDISNKLTFYTYKTTITFIFCLYSFLVKSYSGLSELGDIPETEPLRIIG